MSGKASFREGEHGPALTEGIGTALSWLSILPFRGAGTFDRITGARVMAAIPVVGVVFGVFTAALIGLLGILHVRPLLAAVLVVLMWELLNRMMHLDGLADVGDALGSYAPPERAREILADPQTGLIGFSAALFSLLAQVAAATSLLEAGAGWLLCFIPAIARLGGQVMARRGRRPFSRTGFGAMLIGTVRPWWIIAWWLALSLAAGGISLLAGPGGTWWIIAVAGLAVVVSAELLARHLSRRFEGLNGDCIGAAVHVATAVAAVCCAGALAAVTAAPTGVALF